MSVPTTEQFLSASKVTELLGTKAAVDHTHEGSGSSGGGVLATSGYATILEMGAGGSYTRCTPGGFVFETPAEGVLPVTGDPVVGGDDGGFGWGYDVEGWFQISLRFWCGFDAALTVPDYVQVEFTDYYDQGSFEYTIPVTPGGIGRSAPGFTTTVTGPVFHSPDKTETGTGQSNAQLVIKWPSGDGVMKNGNFSGPNYAVMARIAKLG